MHFTLHPNASYRYSKKLKTRSQHQPLTIQQRTRKPSSQLQYDEGAKSKVQKKTVQPHRARGADEMSMREI